MDRQLYKRKLHGTNGLSHDSVVIMDPGVRRGDGDVVVETIRIDVVWNNSKTPRFPIDVNHILTFELVLALSNLS